MDFLKQHGVTIGINILLVVVTAAATWGVNNWTVAEKFAANSTRIGQLEGSVSGYKDQFARTSKRLDDLEDQRAADHTGRAETNGHIDWLMEHITDLHKIVEYSEQHQQDAGALKQLAMTMQDDYLHLLGTLAETNLAIPELARPVTLLDRLWSDKKSTPKWAVLVTRSYTSERGEPVCEIHLLALDERSVISYQAPYDLRFATATLPKLVDHLRQGAGYPLGTLNAYFESKALPPLPTLNRYASYVLFSFPADQTIIDGRLPSIVDPIERAALRDNPDRQSTETLRALIGRVTGIDAAPARFLSLSGEITYQQLMYSVSRMLASTSQ